MLSRISKPGVILLLVLVPTMALATSAWKQTFNDLYHQSPETSLGTARCGACHVQSNGRGGLNPYGKQLRCKSISTESLKSIEKLDADGDGVSNVKEIKAGTLPGYPKSKPS